MTDETRAQLLRAAAHDSLLLAFLETLLDMADGDAYIAWTLVIVLDRLKRKGVLKDD